MEEIFGIVLVIFILWCIIFGIKDSGPRYHEPE